jgi:hypothetical protein
MVVIPVIMSNLRFTAFFICIWICVCSHTTLVMKVPRREVTKTLSSFSYTEEDRFVLRAKIMRGCLLFRYSFKHFVWVARIINSKSIDFYWFLIISVWYSTISSKWEILSQKMFKSISCLMIVFIIQKVYILYV